MIILDTHIWIWWVDDNQRLTQQHRKWIKDYQEQGLGISIISCWEVAKLVEVGKLTLSISVEESVSPDIRPEFKLRANSSSPLKWTKTLIQLSLYDFRFWFLGFQP